MRWGSRKLEKARAAADLKHRTCRRCGEVQDSMEDLGSFENDDEYRVLICCACLTALVEEYEAQEAAWLATDWTQRRPG